MEMPPGPPSPAPPSPPTSVDGGDTAPDGQQAADETLNRRLVLIVGAVALVAIGLMAGYLLTGDDDGESASPDPTPAADPTSTTAPDEAPTADELADLVDELQPFVEETRGLEFQEEIDLEVLDDEAFEERIADDLAEGLAEDGEDLQDSVDALQALGVWPPGGDPAEILDEFYGAGTLGVYDTETGEMLVRGAGITPLLRTTLVHELTHALEDQHDDLHRPELDDRDDEAGFAFTAAIEGSASRVEEAYRRTLSDEERAEEQEEGQALIGDVDIASFPPILLAEQQFVYGAGEAFVSEVFDEGGNAAVDQLLEEPPTTTEQILEPSAWPDRQEPEDVAAPEADGEIVDEGVIGQFVLHLLIDAPATLGGDEDARRDLPEWDGDRYVQWEDGDQHCVRMAIAGDLDAMEEGLASWVGQPGVDAELERDGDRLLATSCG